MKVWAAMAVAGAVWWMLGCGDGIEPAGSGMASELVLADPVLGTHYSLSVTDGGLTLTGMGTAGTAASDPVLVDEVTGQGYVLGVAGGSLSLEQDAGSADGVKEIGLTDAARAKTYELAVASGALTLSDGEAQ